MTDRTAPPNFAASFDDVSLRRGNVTALDHVSLDLPFAQTTAILGASGSGKSTLVQLMIGLLTADSGSVTTLGVSVSAGSLATLRRRTGYAIQDVALLPHMSIRDNVLLPAVLDGRSEAEREQRLDELLQMLQLPGDVLGRYPHELSGGQQQRAGLCRAMILRPELLLLDEPFSGLDTMTRRSIHEQFLEVQQREPVSTVLVTHDPQEAINLAHSVVIIREGKVQQFGETAVVFESPVNEYVRRLCTGLQGVRG